MCGIAGCISNSLPKAQVASFVKQSLLVNSLRGTDGSGLFVVDKQQELFIFKKPIAGPDFIQLNQTLRLANMEDLRFVVTHNRSGTNGNYYAHNHTHPINYEHITLVHNGTLSSTFNLDVSTPNTHDSSAIAESIAKYGAKATLEKLNGSFALVWYDAKEHTLNTARNSERPLFLANVKDNKGVLFASEPGMLSWLAARNDITVNSVFSLKENIWSKVFFDSKIKNETVKFTPYKPKIITYSSSIYTTVGTGDEFTARFVGDVSFSYNQNKEKFFKFTHNRDQVYGWLVLDEGQELKEGFYYKLKAVEARLMHTDTSNKKATMVSTEEIKQSGPPLVEARKRPAILYDTYKPESYVTFELLEAKPSRKDGVCNFVGITADSNEVTVQGYNCAEHMFDYEDDYYVAKVRAVCNSRNTGETYILVYPESIKGFSPNKNKPADSFCAFCGIELSLKEVALNKCPDITHDAVVCDGCWKYRGESANAERIL